MEVVNWQALNIVLSVASTITSGAIAIYAWQRRQVQGAFWFAALNAAVSWIAFWYILEAMVGRDVRLYVLFSNFEYIGLTFIPVLWIGFAQNFSGRALSRNALIALSIIPAVTTIAAFTNNWHGLIYVEPRFAPNTDEALFEPVYGLVFWIYVVYSYIVFFGGSVILVRAALRSWKLYRAQALLFLIGTALPWLSNLLQIFDSLNPFPYLYVNALLMLGCVICFAFALFRLRLLDIRPLAYETIVNSVPDGLIVVDLQDRIVALNRHVRPFLDQPNVDPIGKHLRDAFSRYTEDLGLNQAQDATSEFPVDNVVIEMRISPVVDRQGKPQGRLFVLSDVTARAKIQQSQREERLFADTMRVIGTTLNSTLDTNRVLELILDSIGQFVLHSHANIMMIEDGYTTTIRHHRGYSPEAAARLEAMAFDYRDFPTLRRTSNAMEPVIVPDTQHDDIWQVVEGLEDVQSFACVPIRADGELVGFINIDGDTPHVLEMDMTGKLQIFAQQAALAIKNARLYEQTRQQADELSRRVSSLTITQQMYSDIGFSLNETHLLEMVLDATMRLSTADSGYIALLSGENLKLSNVYGSYPTENLQAMLDKQAGIIGKALTAGQPQMLSTSEVLESTLPRIHAQIALPIVIVNALEKDELFGILVLETTRQEHFTKDRFQLLGLIADRVAVALENARLVGALKARATELESLYERVKGLEQLKSDMIRIAAHDLKNPLSVVLNYLVLETQEPDLDLNWSEVHKTMLNSARRMHQIIDDFLSLERIERVAQQQTIEVFDLCELVAKAKIEFGGRAAQKSQQLDVTMPDNECCISGDKVLLYEAISNFMTNAIKYTPDGGQVSVHLTDDGSLARLEVRDTGFGIPDEKQNNLFQPGFRARTRETKDIEGTGLGLHLTKNIVEGQGGTIIFYSTYGKGSMFGFQMPLNESKNVAASGAV